MKQVIRKVLPRALVDLARTTRDDLRLATAPRREFAHRTLRPTAMLGLPGMLDDERFAAAWERDHAAIAALFGDGDRSGGINPGDRRAIHALILALKPDVVLEIGTHIGASTLYIARALREVSPIARVVTVDIVDVNDPARGPWMAVGIKSPPRDLARELDCHDRIVFVQQRAEEFMARTDERFGLVFLDGDHSPLAVYNEVAAALRILRPGGVILLHDYYAGGRALFPDGQVIAGPFRALERIRRENPAIAVTPLGELPWPTKQGTRTTSLALVSRASSTA